MRLVSNEGMFLTYTITDLYSFYYPFFFASLENR